MRSIDENGYILVKDNPLTKEGVFPYSGGQLGLEPSEKVFYVYRPAEELQDPETIESFKLVPFINEHQILGVDGVPPESKGILGVVGQNVEFDAPYLKADIKIYGENMKELLERGKNNISAGYSFVLDKTPGKFNGKHYDCIQRKIRANHIALVDEGRCGNDVRVYDSNTLYNYEPLNLSEKNMEISVEEFQKLTQRVDELENFKNKLKPYEEKEHGSLDSEEDLIASGGDPAESDTPETDKLAPETEADDEVDDEDVEADAEVDTEDEYEDGEEYDDERDAADGRHCAADTALRRRIRTLESKLKAQDSALFKQFAKRDSLAKAISEHTGTFVYDTMTLKDVVKYGAKKFGVAPSFNSVVAYMKGRIAPRKEKIIAQDSAGILSAKTKIEEFYK